MSLARKPSDEIRPLLSPHLPPRHARCADALPRHHRAGRVRRQNRHRLCLDRRAPLRPPRRTVSIELRVPVVSRGANEAHPPRHRRDGAAAERSGPRRRAGRDPRPAFAGALRLRRRPRLHPRRVRHLRRRHEREPRACRGRRRTHQAGLDRPDDGVRQQVPSAAHRHAAAAARVPEAASADLGGVPDVAGELRVDGERGPQPALRRLSRRSSDRSRSASAGIATR